VPTSDGGQISLDWVSRLENYLPFFGGGGVEDNKACSSSSSDATAAGNASSSSSTRPILILFHGLTGGSHETYVCIDYVMFVCYDLSIMHACMLCYYVIMYLEYMHKFRLEATKLMYLFMYCVTYVCIVCMLCYYVIVVECMHKFRLEATKLMCVFMHCVIMLLCIYNTFMYVMMMMTIIIIYFMLFCIIYIINTHTQTHITRCGTWRRWHIGAKCTCIHINIHALHIYTHIHILQGAGHGGDGTQVRNAGGGVHLPLLRPFLSLDSHGLFRRV
jgi:hypothetical protein